MVVHVTSWGAAGRPRAILVHGSMTWGTDELFGFPAQRPLADAHRLLLPDRRGYGDSPDVEHSDHDVDADDVLELLGDGGHLVGHSYGGVVAMLAAARRPAVVRSLTLIEPGCYQVAAGDPTVRAALERNRAGMAGLPPDLSAEEFLRMSTEPIGLPMPDPTPRRLRATRSAMRERPCWEADVPVEPLAAAPWPKLVITGTWEDASPAYREYGGEPLMACGRVTAERIGAELLRVAGASHWPHVERPEVVNSTLRALWDG
jgi:pimeloyl-ACP methyl ester carboxylesterase